ncbi:MAG TPA: hypothetical protein VFD29_04620 [Gillisia sp.]|nr:hypothetical protein [Gillisia sp.]
MESMELKKRLIDKIQKSENNYLLEEAYRLLELETHDLEVYKLNDEQKSAVAEAREQIKNGQVLTDDKANQEIDSWLKK